MSERGTIAVVGAGIVGVCCALELQRQGFTVRLIDRQAPGRETSYGNAGVISLSSMLPLNGPSLLRSRPGLATNRRPALRYGVAYLLVFRALQNYIGLRRARVAMTGAAPISPKIVRFFRTIGVPLVEVYGATETSGVALGQKDRKSVV